MNVDIVDAAYLHCRNICKNSSTTFFSSFSTLKVDKRRAVHAVYALCRLVDDIVDGDDEPDIPISEKLIEESSERDKILRRIHAENEPVNPLPIHMQRLMALVSVRNNLQKASQGRISEDDELLFIALQDVFTKYPIQMQDFETLIDGMEDDLFFIQHRTWDDLRSYCYKVASAVGLILIEIYGYSDRAARLHAIDLGIQLQLINVLRDVSEDYERGRVYLPIDVLGSYNIDRDCLDKPGLHKNKSWRSFIAEYIEIVSKHQSSAMHLFRYLDVRSKFQPIMMSDAYTKIFREIIRRSGDVFTTPVKLSRVAKTSLWMKMFLMKIRLKMV